MGPSEMDPSEIWHNWGGGGEENICLKWGYPRNGGILYNNNILYIIYNIL